MRRLFTTLAPILALVLPTLTYCGGAIESQDVGEQASSRAYDCAKDPTFVDVVYAQSGRDTRLVYFLATVVRQVPRPIRANASATDRARTKAVNRCVDLHNRVFARAKGVDLVTGVSDLAPKATSRHSELIKPGATVTDPYGTATTCDAEAAFCFSFAFDRTQVENLVATSDMGGMSNDDGSLQQKTNVASFLLSAPASKQASDDDAALHVQKGRIGVHLMGVYDLRARYEDGTSSLLLNQDPNAPDENWELSTETSSEEKIPRNGFDRAVVFRPKADLAIRVLARRQAPTDVEKIVTKNGAYFFLGDRSLIDISKGADTFADLLLSPNKSIVAVDPTSSARFATLTPEIGAGHGHLVSRLHTPDP